MKQNISSEDPGGVDQNLIRWLVAWLRRREWNMSEAEARDVVGAVLVKHVENPPRRVFSLKAYLCWMIRNEVKERHRLRHERALLARWPMDDALNCTTEVDYENEYALSRILNKLPDREREVLVLNYVFGMALTDIAKGMNVSYSQVYRLLTKALTRCHALAGRTHGDQK